MLTFHWTLLNLIDIEPPLFSSSTMPFSIEEESHKFKSCNTSTRSHWWNRKDFEKELRRTIMKSYFWSQEWPLWSSQRLLLQISWISNEDDTLWVLYGTWVLQLHERIVIIMVWCITSIGARFFTLTCVHRKLWKLSTALCIIHSSANRLITLKITSCLQPSVTTSPSVITNSSKTSLPERRRSIKAKHNVLENPTADISTQLFSRYISTCCTKTFHTFAR